MRSIAAALLFLILAGRPVGHAQNEPMRKVWSRFYSEDHATVAEVLEGRSEVDVSKVGSTQRCTLSNFSNAVQDIEFYDGNRVLAVLVGGPAAGHWPVFYHREAAALQSVLQSMH